LSFSKPRAYKAIAKSMRLAVGEIEVRRERSERKAINRVHTENENND
jgi:hypothetical protein